MPRSVPKLRMIQTIVIIQKRSDQTAVSAHPFKPVFSDKYRGLKFKRRNCILNAVNLVVKYKSEILKVSFKLLKSSIREEEVHQLDELINKRASEGWELAAYTFSGGGDISKGILVTFKKD